jgi:hypothetical protein
MRSVYDHSIFILRWPLAHEALDPSRQELRNFPKMECAT